MAEKSMDLTGCRFGKLKVIKRIGTDNSRHSIYECICDCGKITTASTKSLKSGDKIIQMLMDMNTMVDAASKFATNGEITIKISAIGHIPMDTMKMQIADNVPLIESMLMEIMSLIIVGG